MQGFDPEPAPGDGEGPKDQQGGRRPRLSRRGFLGGAGLLGAGAAVGAVAGVVGTHEASGSTSSAGATVPFYGPHQAGIATAAQDRLAFAAFDLTSTSRSDLQELLREWTAAAAAMCAGRQVPGGSSNPVAPPADTGEAVGLPPAQLTITFGVGPKLFDDRFGLASRRPAALAPLPALPADNLVTSLSDGDLCIQACSNDPVVAFHAIRNLARIGRDVVAMRWSQLGFGRTSSTSSSQATPRNLMGFKDGTRNIVAEDTAAMDQFVWVGAETDQAWMRGGSYAVTRRIAMHIEGWDRDYLSDQEHVFGRSKVSGAPLTGHKEFDTPNFAATAGGSTVIDAHAHIALAAHENNNGLRILRRGYSFTDGTDPDTGELDAGLFFIAYQKNAHDQFVVLQRKLGAMDLLNEYIEHTSSALFACPPGVRDSGDYWASALFA